MPDKSLGHYHCLCGRNSGCRDVTQSMRAKAPDRLLDIGFIMNQRRLDTMCKQFPSKVMRCAGQDHLDPAPACFVGKSSNRIGRG